MILDLISVEERGETINYYPRERTAEINYFVHSEGHNAGSQNIVAHIGIPGSPEPLKEVERDLSSTYLIELGPVFGNSLRQSRIPAISVEYAM
jgi:hypothetical protein